MSAESSEEVGEERTVGRHDDGAQEFDIEVAEKVDSCLYI